MKTSRILLSALVAFASTKAVHAQERVHWTIPLRELVPAEKLSDSWSRDRGLFLALWPRVVLEPGATGIVQVERSTHFWRSQQQLVQESTLLVRGEAGKPVKGKLFVPDAEYRRMIEVPFTLAADLGQRNETFAKQYASAEAEYLEALLEGGVPGTAWFRHRLQELARKHDLVEVEQRIDRRGADRVDTYDLFTGGRALSENLQLDRGIGVVIGGDPDVDVESIQGIKIKELDWSKKLGNGKPALDPLAPYVPHDQHAIFVPSFQALLVLTDEADRNGTPILQSLEPRAEDARVSQRYERQLCIGTSGLGRLLGPHLIGSIVITGADPYLRVGADVAVIFAAKDAGALEKLLVTQTRLMAGSDATAKPTEGSIAGTAWAGVRSPDRSICTHVARLGDAVVVTNSEAQLARIAKTFQKKEQSLAELAEYAFFRARYPLGASEETALAVLSDATIRRWCSPRWRIGDSRRTRALAWIAEQNCRNLDALAGIADEEKPLAGGDENLGLGTLTLSRRGVRSSIWGDAQFATPILELSLDKVTKGEKEGYETWRSQYERYWRGFFDPIALQVRIGEKKLAADLTVMPLITGSEYGDWIAVTQGVEIRAEAVDAHDTLGSFAIAINREAKSVQNFAAFAAGFTARGENRLDPLGWLGTTFTIHAESDPFWGELAAAKDIDKFLERNWHRMPFLLQIESVSALKLTAFLAAVRAAIQSTAPGMTHFEARDHKGQAYVRITPSAETQQEMREVEKLAVHYAASGDALVLTLNEDAMKRALERRAARREARAESRPLPAQGAPLLGKSVCLQAKDGLLEPWRLMSGDYQRNQIKALCWGNLPILEEWRRRFPSEDPVAVHERLFGTRLVDPSGGVYVWNAQLACMESSVLGSPMAPKSGPDGYAVLATFGAVNFGLTFEDDGLRARAEIERK